MSTLFISEYSSLGFVGGHGGQTIHAPAAGSLLAEQAISIGVSSVPSAAFNAATKFIEIVADVDCALAFGASNVVANTLYHYVPSKNTRYYAVNGGMYLATITSA